MGLFKILLNIDFIVIWYNLGTDIAIDLKIIVLKIFGIILSMLNLQINLA